MSPLFAFFCPVFVFGHILVFSYADKKIKFSSNIRKFIVEQLQSHIRLTSSSYMGKYLRVSSYIRKPFLIYDFATAPLWISLNMMKIWFYFLSVYTCLSFALSSLRLSVFVFWPCIYPLSLAVFCPVLSTLALALSSFVPVPVCLWPYPHCPLSISVCSSVLIALCPCLRSLSYS